MESENFKVYTLCGDPSRNKSPHDIYEKAYALWKAIWATTLKDLDGVNQISSDNFTRQDEIIALFAEKKCVALVCHRFVNLENQSSWDDSYFAPWPKKAIEMLTQDGTKIAIGSQITIHPEFRKSSSRGLSIKDMITELSLKHLSMRDLDAITGVMRADKGMNSLFYKYGAVPLMTDQIFHHVPVDLVAFFPKSTPLKIRLPQAA